MRLGMGYKESVEVQKEDRSRHVNGAAVASSSQLVWHSRFSSSRRIDKSPRELMKRAQDGRQQPDGREPAV